MFYIDDLIYYLTSRLSSIRQMTELRLSDVQQLTNTYEALTVRQAHITSK